MKDFLSIKNVTFGYGSRTILEDVSLRFGSGQVVAIMGLSLIHISSPRDA